MTTLLPESLWSYILESYVTSRNKSTLAALSATNWDFRRLTLPLLFRSISLVAPLPEVSSLKNTIIWNSESILTRTNSIVQRVAKLWCNSQTSQYIRHLEILKWGLLHKEIEDLPSDISSKYGILSPELQRVWGELESAYQLILEEFAPTLRLDTLIISDSKLNKAILNVIKTNSKLRNVSIINHTGTELDPCAVHDLSRLRIVSLELSSHKQYINDPLLLRYIVGNNQTPLFRLKTSLDIISAIDQDILAITLSGLQSLILTQSSATLYNVYTLRRLLSTALNLRRLQISGPLWTTSRTTPICTVSDIVESHEAMSILEESKPYQFVYLEFINIPIDLIGILVPNKPIRSVSIQLMEGPNIPRLPLLQDLQYYSPEIVQLELKEPHTCDIELTNLLVSELAKYVPNITVLKLPALDVVSGADLKEILQEMLTLAHHFSKIKKITLYSQHPHCVKFQERAFKYEQRGHAFLETIEVRHLHAPAHAWLWFPGEGWTLVTLFE